jgi:hypothetical protein
MLSLKTAGNFTSACATETIIVAKHKAKPAKVHCFPCLMGFSLSLLL